MDKVEAAYKKVMELWERTKLLAAADGRGKNSG